MAENKVVYTITLNDLLSPKVKKAEKNTIGLDKAVQKTNISLKSLAKGAAAAFGAFAIVDTVKNIVFAGAEVEKAQIGLTTLLGDAAQAQQVISQTMQDAAKTPFDFNNLLQLNKLLIGAQVPADRARKDVLNLANAVAATGGGNDELSRMAVNLQQIKNVGKATALDIKQFAFAGINIYKVLADATGKTTEEAKDLEVTYDLLTYALQRAANEGGLYAGGLDAMADSTAVRISNLGDAAFQLSVKIFNKMKPAIDAVIGGLGLFIDATSSAVDWVSKNEGTISILATTVAAYATVANLAAIKTFFLTGATQVATAAQWLWNAAMTANPIGVVIVAIGALAAGIKYLYDNFDWARGAVVGVWEALKTLVTLVKENVINVFTGLGKVISGIFTFDLSQIKEGLSQATKTYREAGSRLAKSFKKGYTKGVADFNADKEAEKIASSPAEAAKNKFTGIAAPTFKTKSSNSSGGVKSPEIKNINISIENLVREFTVTMTKLEDVNKIREKVKEAVLGAINDSQIITG